MQYIINTREDLDSIKNTAEYDKFMSYLKGTMLTKVDKRVYPEDYNTTEYAGENLEPVWEESEDLTTINRFGFDKSDFQ